MKYLIFLLILLITISPTLAQWQIQNSGTSDNLNDVDILDYTFPNSAVVVGNNGLILKTTNNGYEWEVKNSGTANHLNAVSFCWGGGGVAVGNKVICLTTDGGESWSSISINKNGISVDYIFSQWYGGNILIGCDDGTIFYSNDVGSTWQDTVLTNESVVATGFVEYFPHQNEGVLFVTNSNTGETFLPLSPLNHWDVYNNPIGVSDKLTSGELSYDYQYLIGARGNSGSDLLLLKKYKLDTLWLPTNSSTPVQFTPEDIAIYYNYNLFICGSNGKIFTSIDDGVNWLEQITGVNFKLNSIEFRYNNPTGYSVGDSGTILFTSNGGGINSVDEIIPPTEVYLYQNYPNPFNPTTKIKFTIPAVKTRHASYLQMVSLKIFDILGSEIAILVNDELSPGEYEAEFSPESSIKYPATGIYLYTLRVSDPSTSSGLGFVQTKKMIYLK